jgi:glycosyltransferase involved in cell wall biosynthesis
MSADQTVAQSRSDDEAAVEIPSRRPPTVLQLVSRLDGGGGHRLAIDLASQVVEAGGRALIAYDGVGPTYELTRLRITPVVEKLTRRNPIASYTVSRRLRQLARNEAVNIVHAQNATLAALGHKIAREANCRLVTTFCDGPGDIGALGRSAKSALAASDHIITHSLLIGRKLPQAMPDVAQRISVVPYGVDLAKFDPQRVAAERVIALSQALRLPDDKPVIMLPGRYAPQKGHALLLEALHLIRDFDFRCVILGPSADGGAYREQLERLTENLGLSDRVLLTDECRDMPAALMLADLVVAPYLAPSVYNRVALEAQALGRPIVTTDFPTAREAVEGSPMAWLVPPNDARRLAAAIGEAIALPLDERHRRTPQVIDNIRQRSDLEGMRRTMLGIYWSLTGFGAA